MGRVSTGAPPACLNCGAPLAGPYCGACGQQDRPPNPTLREMLEDAWENISGFDSRLARTFRMLLFRPGALTREVMQGRRARYIPPVRLYLVASVAYFLAAAAIPNLRRPEPATVPGSNITIDLLDPDATVSRLTPEQRQQAMQSLQRAPAMVRPLLEAALFEPAQFRQRFFTALPRALFALVPVFAAIVALFYRGRRFPQHLLFALHLHAAVFVFLTIWRLANASGSSAIAAVFEVAALVWVPAYACLALRRVFDESWARTLAKSLGIAVLYALAGGLAIAATLAWTVMT